MLVSHLQQCQIWINIIIKVSAFSSCASQHAFIEVVQDNHSWLFSPHSTHSSVPTLGNVRCRGGRINASVAASVCREMTFIHKDLTLMPAALSLLAVPSGRMLMIPQGTEHRRNRCL